MYSLTAASCSCDTTKTEATTTAAKMDSHGWSTYETRSLISIWAEESVQRKLNDSYRNRAIYEEISKKMEGDGYCRSWQQCQRKIKHLKHVFRKAKGSNNKSSRDRIGCPFYEELDKVLGDRPSFCPGEGDVLDSELDDSQEEPLYDSTMDAIADATVPLSKTNVTSAGTHSDNTTGPDAAASSSSQSSSSSSSERPPTSTTAAKMDSCGWTTHETRCLISIWAEESVQRKLNDSYRNRTIYEEISKKMEGNGYCRSWQQCQRKIKHLKHVFRKAKSSNSKSSRDRIGCPFYEELDKVLGDRPSFCPGEGDMLDSELDYSQEEPLYDSTMDAIADAAVPLSRAGVTPAETQGDDRNSDDTTGPDAAATTTTASPPPSSSSSPQSSSSKRACTSGRGRARRKKSRFQAALEAFSKALSDSQQDERLLLQMQRAQHAHEKELFGMMMQSITALASTLASAQRPPSYQPTPPPASSPSAPPVSEPPRQASRVEVDGVEVDSPPSLAPPSLAPPSLAPPLFSDKLNRCSQEAQT